MQSLLNWMYYDFLIGAPAIQLASHYFAPSAPRRRLLKAIESSDREKAIRGVKNAAWDLTLISEWLSRVKKSVDDPYDKKRWILCTLDRSVKAMAEGLLSFDPGFDPNAHLKSIFAKHWDESTAERLADLLQRYQQDAANPVRCLSRDPNGEEVSKFIADGETFLRQWTPRRPSA